MFPWEGQEIEVVEQLMRERDPRRYRLGLFTEGDNGVAMAWLSGRSELAAYLARVAPRRHGLAGVAFIARREALERAVAGLEIRGPGDSLREEINAAARPAFHVLWWGTLEALRGGGDAWSRTLLGELQPPASPPLPPRRTTELITLLRERFPASAD